jgi:hypothetical protein
MHPFDKITSRENAAFPFKPFTSYPRLFMVDWRESEDWIAEAFLRSAGLPANETTWHWDETAGIGKFVSRGRSFPVDKRDGQSAQHAAVSVLQEIYARSYSIRYLNHVAPGDTAYFVVETPATWSALEAANPFVRWFFTPLEYLADIVEGSFEDHSEAARLYEAGRPPQRRPQRATDTGSAKVAAAEPAHKIFLDQCRARLDFERTRSPSVPAADRLRIPAPLARLAKHPLRAVYDEQPVLFEHGRVVWAHVVQANTQLYQMGEMDLAAEFVFSLDPYFDVQWQTLANLAAGLFALKGAERPDTADAAFARVITSETEMVFNLPVPRQRSADKEAFFTTAMVHRNHLPGWILGANLVPFLVAPDKTRASMILPHRYWPYKLWK